jgi:hypothetical protein
MSVEKLAETVGGVADRKGVIKRMSAATLGLLGVAGMFPSKALALCTTHGCDLCTCPSGCSPELVCAWCWMGRCHNHNGVNRRHKCCEGYRGSRCDGACPVSCSYWFGSYAC